MSRLRKFINESKILDFPRQRQFYDWDCGIASLAMVLSFAGKDVREGIIMNHMLVYTTDNTIEGLSKVGAPIEGIKEVSSQYGLHFTESFNMTTQELKDNVDKGWPTLMMIQAWSGGSIAKWEDEWDNGHYVVCIGYDDKKLYFADPASYNLVTKDENSINYRWHGWDDKGAKIGHWGLTYKIKGKFTRETEEEMG